MSTLPGLSRNPAPRRGAAQRSRRIPSDLTAGAVIALSPPNNKPVIERQCPPCPNKTLVAPNAVGLPLKNSSAAPDLSRGSNPNRIPPPSIMITRIVQERANRSPAPASSALPLTPPTNPARAAHSSPPALVMPIRHLRRQPPRLPTPTPSNPPPGQLASARSPTPISRSPTPSVPPADSPAGVLQNPNANRRADCIRRATISTERRLYNGSTGTAESEQRSRPAEPAGLARPAGSKRQPGSRRGVHAGRLAAGPAESRPATAARPRFATRPAGSESRALGAIKALRLDPSACTKAGERDIL